MDIWQIKRLEKDEIEKIFLFYKLLQIKKNKKIKIKKNKKNKLKSLKNWKVRENQV
jgi:hypothetical protein